MPVRRKLPFTTTSTSFLLSIIAFPLSLAAFAFLYAHKDSFWSSLWMLAVLPTIWLSVAVLLVRDAVRRRPWPQIVGSALLLGSTVLLFILMFSPRFWMNQLFTFRALDFRIPANGLAFVKKFSVCAPDATCNTSTTAPETKTFTLRRVPDGCCTLEVVNGSGDKHKAEAVHIFLNGEEVNLRSNGSAQIASVSLTSENKVTVQLTGPRDAFIYVVIAYTGRKEQTAAARPPAAG